MPREGSPAVVPAVGFAGGLLAGLFGVGGGLVMVPGLVLLAGVAQRRAHATSLAAIIPMAVLAAALYLQHGAFDLGLFLALSAGAVVGAPIGSRLLAHAPDRVLRGCFVTIGLLAGARMLVGS